MLKIQKIFFFFLIAILISTISRYGDGGKMIWKDGTTYTGSFKDNLIEVSKI
jgi:hypothetical protein